MKKKVALQKRNRGNLLKLDKENLQKTYTNILNGENLEVLPLRSGRREEYPFSSLLFNILLEVLVNAVRKEKKLNGIWIETQSIPLP